MSNVIKKDTITKLNPCQDRFDNYVKHYGSKSFTINEFLNLVKISNEDKIWVALRLMSKENIKRVGLDVAESVLHIFESEYPNDKRPRLAIEAVRFQNDAGKYIYAAYNAVNRADRHDTRFASYAAYVAYLTTATAYYDHEKEQIAGEVSNAIKWSVKSANRKKTKQEQINLNIIKKYWR